MLSDWSILIRQKLVENAGIENSNETFWANFKHCVKAMIERLASRVHNFGMSDDGRTSKVLKRLHAAKTPAVVCG